MLITCPECSRDVSDKAPTCPNCGYVLASNQPPLVTSKLGKTAVFQFMAIAGTGVALFTPMILVSIVCLFVIATAVVSVFRSEPRRILSIICIGIAAFILYAASSSMSTTLDGDRDYIEKVSNSWDQENDSGYITIHGRVTNDGEKVLQSVKVVAAFQDDFGNTLDTDVGYVFGDVSPGDSKEYDIMHKSSPEYKRILVRIDEVHTKR